MSTVVQQIVARHFGAKVVRALVKRGVEIVDVTNLPNAETGSYANGETGYRLSDGRIRTLLAVIEIANGAGK